jgi:hypothetical protein
VDEGEEAEGEEAEGEEVSSELEPPMAAQPARARRKVTPTATSKVVRFIIYPSRRGPDSSVPPR